MTSAHNQFNYNRRNSTTPYSIPAKHQAKVAVTSPVQSPPASMPIHTPHMAQHHHQYHHSYHSHHTNHHTNHHLHSHIIPSTTPTSTQFSSSYTTPSSIHSMESNFPLGLPSRRYSHSQLHSPKEEYEDYLSCSVPTLSREFVVRRISEGETGRLKQELKCEACGKGYKHISSLAKHLWEHTPEWNVTKKLLISKHQQVQLLEAASILVGMNEPTSRRNSVFQEDEERVSPPTHHRKHSVDREMLGGGYLEDEVVGKME